MPLRLKAKRISHTHSLQPQLFHRYPVSGALSGQECRHSQTLAEQDTPNSQDTPITLPVRSIGLQAGHHHTFRPHSVCHMLRTCHMLHTITASKCKWRYVLGFMVLDYTTKTFQVGDTQGQLVLHRVCVRACVRACMHACVQGA